MKSKHISAWGILALLLCMVISYLPGCASVDTEEYTYDLTFSDEAYLEKCNDTIALEEALTQEYPLQTLREFFSKHHVHGLPRAKEHLGDDVFLYYSQVQEAFPIEVSRTKGYSVYKVSEGGYYYLFWGHSLDPETMEPSPPEPVLMFSTYIGKEMELDAFSSLEVNKSTAQEVVEIDPYFDLVLTSSTVMSFSNYSANLLLCVSYERNQDLVDSYDDWNVLDVTLVKRSSAPGYYAAIFPEDFP